MILINGQPDENISVYDRGLHYGDGLFETIAIVDGKPLCWEQHMRRLKHGCEVLGFTSPATSILQDEADSLSTNSERAVLKLILTRGVGGRGYQSEKSATHTRILCLYDWPVYPQHSWQKGISTCICKYRLGNNPHLAGIKHLNRLEQVLLRDEISLTQHQEGIVLDNSDFVIEGTMSNVFIVKDNTLLTPGLSQCGIAGIIREMILQFDIGIKNKISALKLEDFYNADEIFFCNSIIGIWPVTQLDDNKYDHGPYTKMIKQKLLADSMIVV